MFETDPRQAPRRHHRDPRHGPDNRPFPFREMFNRARLGGQAIRRGEIRPLILAALLRKPMHGYEVIQELEAESGGRWRPSAGSVYPTLQQLADEGLVTSDEIDGRRTYTLTDSGRAAAAAAPKRPRWGNPESGQDQDIRALGLQLVGAVMQVQRVGSEHARQETGRILLETRRQIYRLLADDEEQPTETGETGDAGDADISPDPA